MTSPLPSPDRALLDALPAPLAAQIAALVWSPADEHIPTLPGAPDGALVRWLYRLWLDTREDAPPLLCVKAAHMAGASADWWHTARGGWLCIDAAALPSALEEPHARGAFMRVLREDGLHTLHIPDARWLDRLAQLDALHDVRADPSTATQRRHMLQRCQQREPILLQSEPHSGADQLTRWAHLTLADAPLSALAAGAPSPRPHDWAVCADLQELDQAGWSALRERLREPTPAAWAPPISHATRPAHPALAAILGTSPALCDALARALRLAPHPIPVLITGEPGTGKELFARALHAASGRTGPFVALDMGAISEQLAESELFGHKRGAFSGADRERAGAIRSAHGGTLLLDEIGNISLPLQARLLRVLQEREVRPVGEDRAIPVDVRIIAATNADLEELARRGLFRLDLLGRLRGATLELPPLRDRAADLPELAAALLPGHALTPDALVALAAHPWPGNVRELGHTLLAASLVVDPGAPIDRAALGLGGQRGPTIVQHFGGLESAAEGLPPSLAQRLTAAPLRLPALRERPAASRRAMILRALWGRPISTPALRLLQEHPWWGNMAELEACTRLLAGRAPGPIDLDTLRAELPQISPPAALAPIHVLMSPTLVGPGLVGGLSWEIDAGALLIGRVQGIHELDLAARRGDQRAAQWLDAVRRRCPAPPSCLALTHLRQISRAHLLVTRAEGGLALEVMPATGMEVRCGPLGDQLTTLTAGQAHPVGLAAELWICQAGAATPDLQLFIFAGRATATAMGLDALAAAERLRDPMLATAHDRATPSSPSPAEPDPSDATLRWRIWPLNDAEAEVMVDLLASYQGGQLKHHLLTSLPTAEGGKTARLAEFLRGVPRLSQYLVRLLALPENARVIDALRARHDAMPDGSLRGALLPRGIQELL
jgi:DNA-binding NtrC family response regulator